MAFLGRGERKNSGEKIPSARFCVRAVPAHRVTHGKPARRPSPKTVGSGLSGLACQQEPRPRHGAICAPGRIRHPRRLHLGQSADAEVFHCRRRACAPSGRGARQPDRQRRATARLDGQMGVRALQRQLPRLSGRAEHGGAAFHRERLAHIRRELHQIGQLRRDEAGADAVFRTGAARRGDRRYEADLGRARLPHPVPDRSDLPEQPTGQHPENDPDRARRQDQ